MKKVSVCLFSAGGAFSMSITEALPRSAFPFHSFPYTLCEPFASKSEGDGESGKNAGAYPQSGWFCLALTHFWGSSTHLWQRTAIYLFICFVHVLFQTYNVHHHASWVGSRSEKNLSQIHGEPDLHPRPPWAPHPSAPGHTLLVFTAPFFKDPRKLLQHKGKHMGRVVAVSSRQ